MPFHWLLAALAVLAMGAAASAWLWLSRRRRDEADAGLQALGAMRWREFSRFVLDAMRHRGFEVDADPRALAGAAQTDFVLHRGDRRWLLACRHGADARVDARVVHALENAVLANGAAGGILVTTAQVAPDARRAVRGLPRLELLRGGRLWRELRPMLPESLREESAGGARRLALGRMRLAWLGAAAVGVVVLLVGGRAQPPAVGAPAITAPAVHMPAVDAPADPTAGVAPAAGATPSTAPTPPAATVADPAPARPATPRPLPTAGEEAFDRSQVALAVAALPGIANAAWVTDSTLLVDLRSDADARLPEICEILESYESLRTSRLQLQPAPDSGQPVRFRQCRVF